MPQPFDLKGKRIWVAGHTGMVGSAIMRRLASEDCEVITVGHKDLDLRRQADVADWMGRNKPDAIFVAAAKVGGIRANEPFRRIFSTTIWQSSWLSFTRPIRSE